MKTATPANLVPLTDWLIRTGIGGATTEVLVEGVCRGLRDVGVPLDRSFIGQQVLHPVIGGLSMIWTPEEGVALNHFERLNPIIRDSSWAASPFSRLHDEKLPELRFRLLDGEGVDEHDLLGDLKGRGYTDYLCQRGLLPVDERRTMDASFYLSWTTRAPGGFSDTHLAYLRGIAGYLTYALRNANADDSAEVLLRTYLGAGPSRRVLAGRIGRGETEEIEAVIWFSDLQGFTRLTEQLSPAEGVALLNDYAEIVIDAIERREGEVLKFIGDGILAIFPIDERGVTACARAIGAVLEVTDRVARINPERAAAGLAVTSPYIGLNVGEVVYGNVGGRERLDFTVVGQAVNEASRIAALCRSVDQRVVMSEAFADIAGDHGAPLVGLGRFALRGIARPQDLFTIDWAAVADRTPRQDEAAS
ncbi:MAG: adenylate/guanylate cyclase domain-containing protein [Azospirillaceae bacterium]